MWAEYSWGCGCKYVLGAMMERSIAKKAREIQVLGSSQFKEPFLICLVSNQNCSTKKTYRSLLSIYCNLFLYLSFILLAACTLYASSHQFPYLRLVFELALLSCKHPPGTFTHGSFQQNEIVEVNFFQGKYFTVPIQDGCPSYYVNFITVTEGRWEIEPSGYIHLVKYRAK